MLCSLSVSRVPVPCIVDTWPASAQMQCDSLCSKLPAYVTNTSAHATLVLCCSAVTLTDSLSFHTSRTIWFLVHAYWYVLSASAVVACRCLLAVVACMYNNPLSACHTEHRRQAKANEASTGYRHSSSAQPMEERTQRPSHLRQQRAAVEH